MPFFYCVACTCSDQRRITVKHQWVAYVPVCVFFRSSFWVSVQLEDVRYFSFAILKFFSQFPSSKSPSQILPICVDVTLNTNQSGEISVCKARVNFTGCSPLISCRSFYNSCQLPCALVHHIRCSVDNGLHLAFVTNWQWFASCLCY